MSASQGRFFAPVQLFVLAVLVGIGVYDVVTGLRLLFVEAPRMLAPFASVPGLDGAEALLRRLGAFGVVSGASMVAWAWHSRGDRSLRSLMLVVYLVAGLAFADVDQRFFAVDQGYLIGKRIVGAIYFLALVLHFAVRPGGDARRP